MTFAVPFPHPFGSPLGLSPAAEEVLVSFSDSFDRGNGDLGNGWTYTAGLWTISSNSALGAPGLQGEILANPGFEGTYDDESGGLGGTINIAPNWNQFGCERAGGETLDKETTIIHGGSASQKIFVDNGVEGVVTDSATVFPGAQQYSWFQANVWLYGVVGNVAFQDTNSNVLTRTVTPATGTWTQYFATGYHTTANNRAFRVVGGAGAQFYADDASVQRHVVADMFCTRDLSAADVDVSVPLTITTACPSGIVLCLDSTSTPANFLLAYHNGTNAVLLKCLSGAYTSLISSAATYGAGNTLRVVKDGNNVSLYYNGVQIGATQDITGDAYVNNTVHGMFSSLSTNSFASFTAVGV